MTERDSRRESQRGADAQLPGEPESDFAIYRRGGSTPEIRLTVALVLVARRWRALIDEQLRPLGQSSARMEALSAIINAKAPSSQAEIASRLRIEGPTLTRMIDALSRDKLVERNPAPSDRRTNYLNVTEEGETALEAIFEVTDGMRKRLLDGFSEAEIETLSGFLHRLLERLDTGLADRAGASSLE